MDGVHDLGGRQGFGPIEREENEPVFHEPWEGRVRAMMQIGLRLGLYNIDEFRWSVERMDPAAYLSASYYEKWLDAIERLYTEKGVEPPRPRPSAARLLPTHLPRFAAGDKIVARDVHPRGHTRLPRYVRGKPGVVDQVRGTYILPDKNAMGEGEHPEYVYSVRFEARDLWGQHALAKDAVYVDLWESYLKEGTPHEPRPSTS